MNTILLFFSPSLHEQAALETFNRAINPSNLFFLLHILWTCFTRQMVVHSTHPSNRFLFSFPLKSLGSSPSIFERARASMVVRGGACFSFFVSKFVFSARQGRPLQKKVGGGIRSLALRVSSRLLTLKTTMP